MLMLFTMTTLFALPLDTSGLQAKRMSCFDRAFVPNAKPWRGDNAAETITIQARAPRFRREISPVCGGSSALTAEQHGGSSAKSAFSADGQGKSDELFVRILDALLAPPQGKE
jgi:hypothetical protein